VRGASAHRQKVSVSLKPDPERRGDDRLPREPAVDAAHRESPAGTDDEHRRSHFNLIELLPRLSGRKCLEKEGRRQSGALELQDDNVDRARGVAPFAPDRPLVPVKRMEKLRRHGHVLRSDMQLDLQPVRAMIARLVEHHVSIRTRNNRSSRSKKKPVALLKCFCPKSS